MPHFPISAFSKDEELVLGKIKSKRDLLFAPLADFLIRHKVKPDFLSFAGLFCQILAVLFLNSLPWLTFVFLLLNLFFDGLDGVVARRMQREDAQGALMDVICDNVAFYIFMLALIYYHFVNPFWAAFFLMQYVIVVFVSHILNALKVDFPYVVRSKLIIYLGFFIWLISGMSFLDPMLVFFTIYMVMANGFLLYTLRCSLP